MTSSNGSFLWDFSDATSLPLDLVPTISEALVYPLSEAEPEFTKSEYKFVAVLGDLRHKEAVYLFFGSASDNIVLELLERANRAEYLRRRRPDLVPVPPPGQPGYSDYTLTRIFEYWYYTNPQFIREYTQYLILLSTSESYRELRRLSR